MSRMQRSAMRIFKTTNRYEEARTKCCKPYLSKNIFHTPCPQVHSVFSTLLILHTPRFPHSSFTALHTCTPLFHLTKHCVSNKQTVIDSCVLWCLTENKLKASIRYVICVSSFHHYFVANQFKVLFLRSWVFFF